jgi:hypothetical protein
MFSIYLILLASAFNINEYQKQNNNVSEEKRAAGT